MEPKSQPQPLEHRPHALPTPAWFRQQRGGLDHPPRGDLPAGGTTSRSCGSPFAGYRAGVLPSSARCL